MTNTYLTKVTAALDEARTLIVDYVDSHLPDIPRRDANSLDAARLSINVALEHVRGVGL